MKRKTEKPEDLFLSLKIDSTAVQAYRSLISQTELRKWLAPRVISARRLISFGDGNDIEMKLLKSEENHMVRYSWKPCQWPKERNANTFTIEILDLGACRNRTAEGISVQLIHGEWEEQSEYDTHKKIWNSALQSLKTYLEKNRSAPWWADTATDTSSNRVNLQTVKQFIDNIESNGGSKTKKDKKLAIRNFIPLCKNLDSHGDWHQLESGQEIEFRYNEITLFSIGLNGSLSLNWRSIEKFLGKNHITDFKNRLEMEQTFTLTKGRSSQMVAGSALNSASLSQWFIDLIHFGSEKH